MFICTFCKKSSEPGQPMQRIPIETRQVRYGGSNGNGDFFLGTEIVREGAWCGCDDIALALPPDVVAGFAAVQRTWRAAQMAAAAEQVPPQLESGRISSKTPNLAMPPREDYTAAFNFKPRLAAP